jgi:hypothetical protein
MVISSQSIKKQHIEDILREDPEEREKEKVALEELKRYLSKSPKRRKWRIIIDNNKNKEKKK